MVDLEKRRKTKRYKSILYSKFSIFLFVIIILLLMWKTWEVYIKSTETQARLDEAALINGEVKVREDALAASIERLKSDEGIEEEIRNTYGYIKGGEEVIVIVDNDDMPSQPVEAHTRSVWDRIKDWF